MSLTLSDIATLIGIISAIGSAAGAVLVLWLQTKFVKRPAYYHDREEFDGRIKAIDTRLAAVELEHALFRSADMRGSLVSLSGKLDVLTKTIEGMKESMGNTLHGVDKRVTILEQKKAR